MNDTRISERHRRTFFVGLNTGYVKDGAPDERMVAFYEERSSPRLSCAIVGNVVFPGGHSVNAVTATMSRSAQWKSLASTIASRGTTPGIQLATAWEHYEGATSFRPKDWAETIAKSRALARSVGSRRLRQLFLGLRTGTEMAADAGYRHVQLHAAHGYLFSLLMDPRLYDGAADCLELVRSWAKAGREAGLETSLRISLKTGDAGFDQDGAAAFQDAASSLPVDIVDVSSGFYNIDKRLIYPSTSEILRDRHRETSDLAARHPAMQFILSGRASGVVGETLPNIHLGLCRDLIANPRFLDDRSDGCKNLGKCHYHSRGAGSVTCQRWGAEAETLRVVAHRSGSADDEAGAEGPMRAGTRS
jgi:2,4-dienoyl-CoA reductase-like NADH-dependent reductase (Old Yellow Enzyme family)